MFIEGFFFSLGDPQNEELEESLSYTYAEVLANGELEIP